MTPAERKRAQRKRDELAGWREVKVKVAHDQVEVVRSFAASLPPPEAPTDPNQLNMLDALDAAIAGRDTSHGQGSLF